MVSFMLVSSGLLYNLFKKVYFLYFGASKNEA